MVNKVRHEPMRIAGKKVDAENVIQVEYPYTGEIIGTVPAGNAEHAKKALNIAAIIPLYLLGTSVKKYYKTPQKN